MLSLATLTRVRSLATLTRVRSATQVGCDLNNDNKITKVKPGSAAARAGILVGDTIIELEGAPLGDRRVKDVLVKKPKHSFTLLRPK